MIQLKLSNEALDVIDSELAVTMAYEDIRPLKGQIGLVDWRLNGKVSRLILNRRFKGAKGDALLMPAGGRLGAKELLVLGMGFKREITEAEIPEMLNIVLDRILKKKCASFAMSLSDITPGMFEWRNTVRRFVSMLSGRPESYKITLTEPDEFIQDAKRRHMDFSYDVTVQY